MTPSPDNFGGPEGNRTPASAMRMPRNTTLLQAQTPILITQKQGENKGDEDKNRKGDSERFFNFFAPMSGRIF